MKKVEESVNEVVEKNAVAKKKGHKSFMQLKEEMAERERSTVVVRSDDLVILDLSKLSVIELAKKMKQLQDDFLLVGWDPKTKEACINSPDLAERKAVVRAKSDEIKEERGN